MRSCPHKNVMLPAACYWRKPVVSLQRCGRLDRSLMDKRVARSRSIPSPTQKMSKDPRKAVEARGNADRELCRTVAQEKAPIWTCAPTKHQQDGIGSASCSCTAATFPTHGQVQTRKHKNTKRILFKKNSKRKIGSDRTVKNATSKREQTITHRI